jgi:acyl carrier protein
MPGDPTVLTGGALDALVRQIIADVLVVSLERVRPEAAMGADLGAESIDYLDLLFRLEEAFGKPVQPSRWTDFLRRRLPAGNFGTSITVAVVREFAEQEAGT